jgi:hypothetical protein
MGDSHLPFIMSDSAFLADFIAAETPSFTIALIDGLILSINFK